MTITIELPDDTLAALQAAAEAQGRDAADVAAQLFPVVRLDAEQTRDLAHGKRVELAESDVDLAAALTPEGRLAALIELRRGRARVLLGLPTSEVLP